MKKLVRIGKIIILAVAFIVVAFPFFWCLMLSFKSNAEIMSIPTTFFPSEWIVSGYKKVLTEAPFMTWLWNSLFSSVVSTAIVVFTSQVVQCTSLETENLSLLPVYSLVIVVLTTSAGMFFFKKKELK